MWISSKFQLSPQKLLCIILYLNEMIILVIYYFIFKRYCPQRQMIMKKCVYFLLLSNFIGIVNARGTVLLLLSQDSA